MAKLKGPLFSLGATAQIGKTLVYFPWKGLNVVREYVVPAYSRTGPQATQRDFLKAAVAAVHKVMGYPTTPIDEEDITAYGLWASVVQPATTWFNQVVRNYIDQKVAGKEPAVYSGGHCTPASESLVCLISCSDFIAGKITAGSFKYGISKTSLIGTKEASPDLTAHTMTATPDELSPGKKYYVQFVPTASDDYIGAKSGIYHGTPIE